MRRRVQRPERIRTVEAEEEEYAQDQPQEAIKRKISSKIPGWRCRRLHGACALSTHRQKRLREVF